MHAITIPSSKSHTIRALYLSLFSNEICRIENYLECRDTDAMIAAMRDFGVEVYKQGSLLVVHPCSAFTIPKNPINAHNSGLVFRFMTAFASLFDQKITVVGDDSIRLRRVISPLVRALRERGAQLVFLDPPNNIPLTIKGPIRAGQYSLDGKDSQPVSALLMTLPFLRGDSRVLVENAQERSWIDVTLKWMSDIGVSIQNHGYSDYRIRASKKPRSIQVTLDSDFSSATYPLTYSLLSKKPLRVLGLDPNSNHPDRGYFCILQKMGAKVDLKRGMISCSRSLVGGVFDVNNCIDSLVLLCLVGCFCQSPLRLTGASICRNKESNRIEAICSELTKMGARIESFEDGCQIYPSRLRPSPTSSYCDHRIAMTLYLANKLCGFTSNIDNLECIDKSYPNFLRDISSL